MPHLTFPLSNDGPILEAMIGLNGPDTSALVQSAQPIPRPLQVRALIDTGADRTVIAPSVFQRLGIAPFLPARSQTASHSVPVNLFRVGLSISGSGGAGPALVYSDLLV